MSCLFGDRLAQRETDRLGGGSQGTRTGNQNGKTKPRKCRRYSGPLSGKSRTETFRAKIANVWTETTLLIEVDPSDYLAMRAAKISTKSLILKTVWRARRDSNQLAKLEW